MTGRKPTHRFKALNKDTGETATLGAAWLNDDGTLTVKMDPFIVLTNAPGHVLTLFPEAGKEQRVAAARRRRPDDGEDIPF
jgi:hypothetical protein